MTSTYYQVPDNTFDEHALQYCTRTTEMDACANLSGRAGKTKQLISKGFYFRSALVVIAAAPVSKTGCDDDQAARPSDKGLGNGWGPHSARPRPLFRGTIA